jgi:hypothetical protein
MNVHEEEWAIPPTLEQFPANVRALASALLVGRDWAILRAFLHRTLSVGPRNQVPDWARRLTDILLHEVADEAEAVARLPATGSPLVRGDIGINEMHSNVVVAELLALAICPWAVTHIKLTPETAAATQTQMAVIAALIGWCQLQLDVAPALHPTTFYVTGLRYMVSNVDAARQLLTSPAVLSMLRRSNQLRTLDLSGLREGWALSDGLPLPVGAAGDWLAGLPVPLMPRHFGRSDVLVGPDDSPPTDEDATVAVNLRSVLRDNHSLRYVRLEDPWPATIVAMLLVEAVERQCEGHPLELFSVCPSYMAGHRYVLDTISRVLATDNTGDVFRMSVFLKNMRGGFLEAMAAINGDTWCPTCQEWKTNWHLLEDGVPLFGPCRCERESSAMAVG